MAILTEGTHAGEFICSEANGSRSRDTIVVADGETLVAGAVLGRIETGTASSVTTGTGNGVMGAITVGASAQRGDYILTIKTAASNAGGFELIDPEGDVVGTGDVGTAFVGGGLSFTLADGAVDFIAGDYVTITVADGSFQWVERDVADTNGSAVAAGILFEAVTTSGAVGAGVVLLRAMEYNLAEVTWKTGTSQPDIDLGVAELESIGVISR